MIYLTPYQYTYPEIEIGALYGVRPGEDIENSTFGTFSGYSDDGFAWNDDYDFWRQEDTILLLGLWDESSAWKHSYRALHIRTKKILWFSTQDLAPFEKLR